MTHGEILPSHVHKGGGIKGQTIAFAFLIESRNKVLREEFFSFHREELLCVQLNPIYGNGFAHFYVGKFFLFLFFFASLWTRKHIFEEIMNQRNF